MSVRSRLVLGASALLLAVALSHGSCSNTPAAEAPAPAGGASAGSDGAGRAGGDAQAPDVGSAGAPTSFADADIPDGYWQPTGDPGWRTPSWAAPCDTQVATHPEHAAPSLVWEDCGANLPGCSRLVPNWYAHSFIPFLAADVTKQGTTIRMALHMDYDREWRKVIFDETMQPIAAWRGDDCGGTLMRWTSRHVCLALGPFPDRLILLPVPDPTQEPLGVYEAQGAWPSDCSEELLVSVSPAVVGYIRDLRTGQELEVSLPSGEPVAFRVFEDFALFNRWAGDPNTGQEIIDGWIWQRPNTPEKLIDPGSEKIYDIRTDGTTLVWIQTNSPSIWERSPGAIWTSPFARTAAGLQPTQRREAPSTSVVPSYKVIGGGYYALVEQPLNDPERYVHLYRLSDMRHWLVPMPSDLRPADLFHLDSEEIWIMATTLNDAPISIIRQKLGVLGSGD